MRKNVLLILSAIVFVLWLLPDVTKTYKHKHLKPYEEYFMIRNYPDANAGHTAYLRELNNLTIQLKSRRLKSASESVQWQSEGPYNIGGRINTIAVNPENTQIIYVGTVCGGVYKTMNGGEDWFPVFDDNSYLSVAHIVIDPLDVNTIYVGTGDPNISGYPWVGNGIYKSADAGSTWQHLGLDNVGIVTKIRVNPKNTQIIYAATMGIPFERDENRGLYKTLDGGSSWEKVLYLSDDAGIIDLVLLEEHPDTLFAAGWNRIRNYNESLITGEQCKIYRSFDGGANWETIETDLPTGAMSRIGLYISQEEGPEIIAQFVNASYFETEGIYKSSDFGDSWEQLATNGIEGGILGGFGWYFGKVRVNPFNKDQYFILGVDLYRSDDGGENFEISTPPWYTYEVHADKHDLVFVDEDTIILATDGGLYKSSDGGNNWIDIDNIPNTQFYRVTVDPFNTGYYAGGAQDNGTNYGHKADSNNWEHIYGGDGFQPLFDHEDESVFYCETQNGGLIYGYRNNEYYDFYSFTSGISESDRRSWDMPIIMNDSISSLMYTGTYRVYENTNAPEGNWQAISEDLTEVANGTVDEADYRYHVISALDDSPIELGYVVAGTSDGRVHVYNNESWTDISEGLPKRYVTCVRMSTASENHLFVSHSGYKANENIPHIHFSDDLGQTWKDISGNLPNLAINSIYVLNNYSDSVLFVATDGGVYHTLDQGMNWERTGEGMPVFPVYDLAYDDTNHMLVAGTFARSIMTLELESIVSKFPEPSQIKTTPDIAFAVYPNPATAFVTIEYPENVVVPSVKITSLNGAVLLQRQMNRSGENLSLEGIASGVYFVSIVKNEQILATKRLVLQ